MELPYQSFLKISKQAQVLSKYVKTMDVSLSTSNQYVDGKYVPVSRATYNHLEFSSVADMHSYSKHLAIPTHNIKIDNQKALETELRGASGWEETHTMRLLGQISGKLESSVRLIPEAVSYVFRPNIIKKDPIEITEGNYTYRLLTNLYSKNHTARIRLIARNDEPIYDYLDKGFFVMCVNKEKDNGLKEPVFVVSDSYDVNTSHVFMLCKIQPSLIELLKDGCFASRYDAEMLKLKMMKRLTSENKPLYLKNLNSIDEDYRKNTTLIVVGKLLNNEIDKTTLRDITFSQNSAKYENIEIEGENLIDVLSNKLDFNGEFDIYTIAQIYSNHIQAVLDVKSWLPDEVLEIEQGNEKLKKKELPPFKINGISITLAAGFTGTRFINNIRINQDEVAQAVNRAVCYRSAEEYDLFLKSISRMSIKRHDVIANGLKVKIHANITSDEYKSATPGPNAPAIKFIIDSQDKQIKLYINETRQVPVDIGEIIRKIKAINKKTNNKCYLSNNYYYKNKDYVWAAEQLTEALISSTTVTEKITKEDGSVEEKSTVLISKDDVNKLLKVVDEQNKAKIERSKQFLATAVKTTGAEEIEFLGERAYKVTGALRSYAVILNTAKVYDFESKQYRCIVNDRHYKGAGYDDVASRLLALKNDSVMQDQIRTLRGMAQPNAENAHNNYQPERDIQEDVIMPMIDKAFEKIN